MRPAKIEERTLEEIEALVQTILSMSKDHAGRLASVVVAVPNTDDYPRSPRSIEKALSDVGMDFVDVRLHRSTGPLRLLSAEFER